jgi:hypothetical protein
MPSTKPKTKKKAERNVIVTQIFVKHSASRILTRLYCKDCKMQQNYDKVQNGVIYN